MKRIGAAIAAATVAVTAMLCFTNLAGGQDMNNWYAFTPKSDPAPGAIGMQDWTDGPAGKNGRITRDGENLVYNGKPIKLWGLNLCYGNTFPKKDVADKRAAFYQKFGINAVRFHKYLDGAGWSGIQSKDSVAEFDPASLDLMDYQIAKLKEAGIYVELSQSFGTTTMGPADVRDVPYIAEFGPFDPKKGNRNGGGSSTFHFSPEIQNLHIRQITNILQHKNPYTGLTYAEEPAILGIEIINEADVFFAAMDPVKKSPTIAKMTAERFSDWLKKKYGNQEGLAKAWGDKAFDGWEHEGFQPVGENLDKRNILPLGNPWFWDAENLNGSQAYRKQRLLDSLQFLYEMQNEAYDRWIAAVRKAGYQGEIIGSNWQAGSGYAHFANLSSDARVGLVDRHNYFGGGNKAPFANSSMLKGAGSGMLSSGLQQVKDRPFMLSEWIHVSPNEWGVEGPAIIGAYGLGLQGWDASLPFQNGDSGGFSATVGRDQWDATAPQFLGIYPAVARQVLRGDVQESKVEAVRNVHVPSLFEGKLGFDTQVAQQGDVKEVSGKSVPATALAAVRCTVAFTDKYEDTPAFDMSKYVKDGFVVSSTNQLRWKEGTSPVDGFFTMDTPGTKAVVGFANGQKCELGNVSIAPACRFGAIYVTAKERDKDIESSKSLLIVAIARARNSGMQFNPEENQVLQKGQAPILMEPVKAEITIKKAGAAQVMVLDQDGLPTGKTLPIQDGKFVIDGANDKTPYYLVQY